jgi:hypothetical protein
VPAAPERLHRDPVAVHLERDAAPGRAAAPRRPRRERGARRVEASAGVALGEHAGGVVQPDPRVRVAGELGDGRGEPVGAQRGERDRALRRQRPGAPGVGLRGDGFGVGAGAMNGVR